MEKSADSLYIHVPFCARKCLYCGFFSTVGCEALIPDYIRAVHAELDAAPPAKPLRTDYIGGGTPTLLSAEHLAALLEGIRRAAPIDPACEFTVEANPGTLDAAKAAALRSGGANRISLGAQAFQPHVLEILGRIHGPDEIRRSVGLLRAAGFDNIGLDLIFAIPGQTFADWCESLDAAIDLDVQHISAYGLSFDEGTVFTRRLNDGAMRPAPEFMWLRMYDHARQRLAEAGFTHYEISNFARPGRESAHNCNYWHNGSYLGIGAFATEYVDGRRRTNVADVQEYIRLATLCGKAPAFDEKLEPEYSARETAAFNIRYLPGIARQTFIDRTGFDLERLFGPTIKRLRALGLLQYENEVLRLTEKALPLADSVSAQFLSE